MTDLSDDEWRVLRWTAGDPTTTSTPTFRPAAQRRYRQVARRLRERGWLTSVISLALPRPFDRLTEAGWSVLHEFHAARAVANTSGRHR